MADTQNRDGVWVPAVPVPYVTTLCRVRCACGRKFWSLKSYRGHFALDHILGLD
jgi:hypothetical protein